MNLMAISEGMIDDIKASLQEDLSDDTRKTLAVLDRIRNYSQTLRCMRDEKEKAEYITESAALNYRTDWR